MAETVSNPMSHCPEACIYPKTPDPKLQFQSAISRLPGTHPEDDQSQDYSKVPLIGETH